MGNHRSVQTLVNHGSGASELTPSVRVPPPMQLDVAPWEKGVGYWVQRSNVDVAEDLQQYMIRDPDFPQFQAWMQERYQGDYPRMHDEFNAAWNETSADHSSFAMTIQASVAKEFGLDAPDLSHLTEDLRVAVMTDADAVRPWIRAQYALTQSILTKYGISSVPLYRGLVAEYRDDYETAGLEFNGERQVISLRSQPLSSFSTDMKTALSFAENLWQDRRKDGVILFNYVPRQAILSIGNISGVGVKAENEWTVIGHPRDMVAVAWNDLGVFGPTSGNLSDEMLFSEVPEEEMAGMETLYTRLTTS